MQLTTEQCVLLFQSTDFSFCALFKTNSIQISLNHVLNYSYNYNGNKKKSRRTTRRQRIQLACTRGSLVHSTITTNDIKPEPHMKKLYGPKRKQVHNKKVNSGCLQYFIKFTFFQNNINLHSSYFYNFSILHSASFNFQPSC